MIVLSDSLVLSPAAGRSARLPVILWENLATASSITVDSEEAAHPGVHLANPVTTEFWRSANTDEQLISVELTGTKPIDAFGVARHNYGSTEVVCSIEGLSGDDGADWEEMVEEVTLANDAPVLFRFPPALLIGIRLRMQPTTDTPPQAAVVYVGKLLVMEQGVQVGHVPIPYAREREIIVGRSESGEYLGRIQAGGARRSKADIQLLTPEFYRTEVEPFFAEMPPFFWGWAPEDYPYEVGFAWCTNDPKPLPSHIAGYINITLEMDALGL